MNSLQALALGIYEKASGNKETTTATAVMETLFFPTLSGVESGLIPRSSLQLEGRLGLLNTSFVSPILGAGLWSIGYVCTS